MSNEGARPAPNKDIEALSFEDTLADLSSAFVRIPAERISNELERWLQKIGLALNIDRATIGQINSGDSLVYTTHQWSREGVEPTPHALNVNDTFPWVASEVLAGKTIVISQLGDLPAEAVKDLENGLLDGTKSTVVVPLSIGGRIAGGVGFDTVTHTRTWSSRTVQRLQTIVEVFGNALERERSAAQLLRLAEEARQLSRAAAVGEFTASLAHELNQPLGAILSNAQAARRFLEAKKPDLEEIKTAIEEIIHDNSRAVATLRNVRALFRRDQVEMSPLDLRQLLLEAEGALSLEARSKAISMKLDLPPTLPSVVGNRSQLLEVLTNLASNAFDAVCENGEGPREVEIGARPSEGRHVRVAVCDSGKGIDPKLMPRLFDAFFTTKPTGLGIGLRIARSIVESHGGRLWATCNPDRGATLLFELPVKGDEEGRD